MVNCCGLLSAKKEPVPLKGIGVEVDVKDHVATVTSTLQYENKEESPIEAVFVFPLPGDAAICHFSAKIGQTEVVAKVQEKQKAREEYDDALSSGQQAFLLEESEQSPDIFSLSVGSLPPGESASIRLQYVTELAVQADEGLRFCLPAVLNPRYQPQGSEGGSVSGGSAQVTSVPACLVSYSLTFSARVSSPRPIAKVESNCSLDPIQYLNAEQTQATVSLAAGHKFDRDVEIFVYYKDSHQPAATVEAGQSSAKPGSLMGDPVVMLSLYPEFPKAAMSSHISCGEFIFLMDRSGSMGCAMDSSRGQGQTRIDSARDTLLLLLKSLPVGCYFNIYGFGSNYNHIFPTSGDLHMRVYDGSKSVEYSQKSIDDALKEVEKMDADMGGTEILQPLKHIFSQPGLPSQPRQLFIFTDGEVQNTKNVLDLVKRNSGSHRCFSFGIGEGASSALITGMAKEGGGHSQFITGTDRMQPKVMQSLGFSLQPAVVDISVTWDLPKGVSVTTLSPPITTLFQGQRSLVYAQLTGESSASTEGCVTVKYSLAGQPSMNQLHFSLKPTEDTGLTLHRLGAWTLIRSLEMEEREHGGQNNGGMKEKIMEVSIQSGVSSAFTAFIAVSKSNGEAVQGPMLRRNIPAPRMYRMFFSPPRPPGAMLGLKSSMHSLENGTCSDIGNLYMMGSCDMRSIKFSSSSDQSRKPTQQHKDPMLQLISLQKASGSWIIGPTLATVLGKTTEEVTNTKPASVDQEVWATFLALIWLHGFKMEAEVEWKLLVMKAVSWLQAQKAPCLTECVEAANALLGCEVQKDVLGL